MSSGVEELGERMGKLEERMAKVEGIMEEMRTRLNHIESRLNYHLVVMITMWATLIGGILAILFKG